MMVVPLKYVRKLSGEWSTSMRWGEIDFLLLLFHRNISAEFAGTYIHKFAVERRHICINTNIDWIYFTLGCLECTVLEMNSDENMGSEKHLDETLVESFALEAIYIETISIKIYNINTAFSFTLVLAFLFIYYVGILFWILTLQIKRAKIHNTKHTFPLTHLGTDATRSLATQNSISKSHSKWPPPQHTVYVCC